MLPRPSLSPHISGRFSTSLALTCKVFLPTCHSDAAFSLNYSEALIPYRSLLYREDLQIMSCLALMSIL